MPQARQAAGAPHARNHFEAFKSLFARLGARDARVNELVLGGLAVGGGLVTGGVLYLALRPRRSGVVPLEIVEEETIPAPAAFEDAPFSLTAPPRPVPVAVAPLDRRALRPTYDPDAPPELPDSPIQTEWARRQVGPVQDGRMKGVCSGCGTHLSISQARPIRIACPVCGRTRLLAA